MQNVFSNIYVLCPGFYKTGGTELAHQLVYQINKQGGCAHIVYFDFNGKGLMINEAFKKYVDHFLRIDEINDTRDCAVIASETKPEMLSMFKNAKKYIWWMSVDNFLREHDFFQSVKIFGLSNMGRLFFSLRNTIISFNIKNNISHLYQSEYAHEYLRKRGITNAYRLSDYLNSSYLNINSETERQNQVLFNPRKGFDFTQKLMYSAPDIQWVPLQNMTTEQVKDTLLRSKVYIDFGNHPGKDRFPREAAMCGCCVITGKRGSAKYFEDVPIADEFKFDESHKTIPLIISKIRKCLDDYEFESTKFNGYREFIKGEYQTFQDDVEKIFINHK
jgi:hypothetical protein